MEADTAQESIFTSQSPTYCNHRHDSRLQSNSRRLYRKWARTSWFNGEDGQKDYLFFYREKGAWIGSTWSGEIGRDKGCEDMRFGSCGLGGELGGEKHLLHLSFSSPTSHHTISPPRLWGSTNSRPFFGQDGVCGHGGYSDTSRSVKVRGWDVMTTSVNMWLRSCGLFL